MSTDAVRGPFVSIPDAIARTTGLNPQFLVRSERTARLQAAKWRLPQMRFSRDPCSQHVLALHVRGRAVLTRTVGGVRTTKVALPGSITFTPADAAFESRIESPIESVHIYIDAEALPPSEPARRDSTATANDFPGARDPWLAAYFQMLVSECELVPYPGSSTGSTFLAETERLLLRHLEQRYCTAAATARPGDVGDLIVHPLRPVLRRRVEDYVEANLHRHIALKPLAELAHVSVDHFVRTFHAAVGQTPHQFVLERRLERAAMLLRRDMMPIADVARAAGFPNAAHFSTRFTARYGMSPSRFRKT